MRFSEVFPHQPRHIHAVLVFFAHTRLAHQDGIGLDHGFDEAFPIGARELVFVRPVGAKFLAAILTMELTGELPRIMDHHAHATLGLFRGDLDEAKVNHFPHL